MINLFVCDTDRGHSVCFDDVGTITKTIVLGYSIKEIIVITEAKKKMNIKSNFYLAK